MPVINLLNQSSPNKSVDENSASLINMYLTQDNDQGKYQVSAYPTPGLPLYKTINSPVRAMFEHQNVLYAIGANTFYSIIPDGTVTTIGTITTSSGFVKIRCTNNYVGIIDKTRGYYYDIPNNIYGAIPTEADGNFVNTVTVTAGGSGYTGATIVTPSGGTPTTAATFTPVISSGVITAVLITNLGKGYASAPSIVITDSGGGTGATATCTVQTNIFQGTEVDIECQDEFGILLEANSQQWLSSSVSDLRSWPALSFASTTGQYDDLVAVASLHRELWFLQQKTTEIWDNQGNVNFTWGRNESAYIEYGCVATQSVVRMNNTIFYLAQSQTGGPVVVNQNGYTPQIISTSALNQQLSSYATVSDAIAFGYQQEGQEFYVLTFPTQGITWCYDVSLQLWAQRQSLISASQTRWLPSCYAFFNNMQLVGDSQTGNIYTLDMNTYTENSNPITRTIITHPFYSAGVLQYCSRLQIDFDQTPGASLSAVNLYVSRDGGNTFGSAKAATPVQTSDGQWRVYWTRLGSARTFVFKIVTTINNKFIILGAWANFTLGTT